MKNLNMNSNTVTVKIGLLAKFPNIIKLKSGRCYFNLYEFYSFNKNWLPGKVPKTASRFQKNVYFCWDFEGLYEICHVNAN